jgi:hypothetical protein
MDEGKPIRHRGTVIFTVSGQFDQFEDALLRQAEINDTCARHAYDIDLEPNEPASEYQRLNFGPELP